MPSNTLDDLLRAADKGEAIGTTQRYFKSAPKPAPTATPTPAPAAPTPPAESEQEVIDRVLGRKRQSMSDAPGNLAAGQQYAAAQGTRVLLPSGQVAEFPPEMSHAEIEAAVRKHLGVPEPETKKAKDKREPSFLDTIRGEWAKTKKAESELKSPVIKAIEGVTPGASTAVSTVATAGGGALAAKLAPAALKTIAPATGRLLTSTGIKALERVAKGETPLGWDAIVDAALEVGTEGLSAGIGRALKGIGAAKRAFDYTGRSPAQGLEYVRDRIKNTKAMIIPSIDPTKKVTWDEAITALNAKRGTDWLVTKKEIANWMNMADKQALGPKAGQVFQQMTKTRRSMGRTDPPEVAKLAEGARGALRANPLRAAEDEAATERDKYGVPGGVYAWEALKGGGGYLMEKVGSPFLRAASHMIP